MNSTNGATESAGNQPDDRFMEALERVLHKVAGVGHTGSAALLDAFAVEGLTVLRTQALREMERATRDAIAAVSVGRRPGREPIWGVFEQLGHNKYPGRITVETLAGSESYRIDVPDGDGWVTHYVGGGTMYGVHPCSEQVVRHLAAQWGPPEPAHPWELKGIEPAESATSVPRHTVDPDDDDGGDDTWREPDTVRGTPEDWD